MANGRTNIGGAGSVKDGGFGTPTSTVAEPASQPNTLISHSGNGTITCVARGIGALGTQVLEIDGVRKTIDSTDRVDYKFNSLFRVLSSNTTATVVVYYEENGVSKTATSNQGAPTTPTLQQTITGSGCIKVINVASGNSRIEVDGVLYLYESDDPNVNENVNIKFNTEFKYYNSTSTSSLRYSLF